jgi:putative restriction endonuclease
MGGSNADELSRRLEPWEQSSAGDAANAEPSILRSMRVYGGARGTWVDKITTAPLSPDGQGIAVSILYTGQQHYPDDLSDDGLIYHYPTTIDPRVETQPRFRLPRTLPHPHCLSS